MNPFADLLARFRRGDQPEDETPEERAERLAEERSLMVPKTGPGTGARRHSARTQRRIIARDDRTRSRKDTLRRRRSFMAEQRHSGSMAMTLVRATEEALDWPAGALAGYALDNDHLEHLADDDGLYPRSVDPHELVKVFDLEDAVVEDDLGQQVITRSAAMSAVGL